MNISNNTVKGQRPYSSADFRDANSNEKKPSMSKFDFTPAISKAIEKKKLSSDDNSWKQVPYKLDDNTTVYLALVDQNGVYNRPVSVDDLLNCCGKRDKLHHWKKSSPASCNKQNKPLYMVALNENGQILYGIQCKNNKAVMK